MLPLLETGSCIEVSHSFENLSEFLTSSLLEQKHSLDRIPNLSHLHFTVLLDDLLIASAQHLGDLSSQVPLLHSLLTIEILNILF